MMFKVNLVALVWIIQVARVASFAPPSWRGGNNAVIAAPSPTAIRAAKVELSPSLSRNNHDQRKAAMAHFWHALEQKERALVSKLGATRQRVRTYQRSLAAVRAARKQVLKQPNTTNLQFEESTTRSMIKSLVWRMIAGSVTFYTTLQFSGSIAEAWQVVSADFMSKSVTMFLGERLMNKSQAGRQGGADNVQRSLAKALIWRAFAIVNTLTMAVFVTKDLSIASKIASVDAVFKTALMFQYERVAARVPWGKVYALPTDNATAKTNVTPTAKAASPSLLSRLQQKVGNLREKLPRLLPLQQPAGIPIYGANATALDMSGGIAM